MKWKILGVRLHQVFALFLLCTAMYLGLLSWQEQIWEILVANVLIGSVNIGLIYWLETVVSGMKKFQVLHDRKGIKMTVKVSNPRFCPGCGNFLDAATEAVDPESNLQPEAGDLSLCVYCGSLFEYQVNGDVRVISDEDYRTMPIPTPVRKVIDLSRKYWSDTRHLVKSTDDVDKNVGKA